MSCLSAKASKILIQNFIMVFSTDRPRPMMKPPKLMRPARFGIKGNARVPSGKIKSGKKEVVGLVVFETAVAVDVDEEVMSTATDGDADEEVLVK